MLRRDHFDALGSFVILAVAAYLMLEASSIGPPANIYPLVILTLVIALAAFSMISAIRRAYLNPTNNGADIANPSWPGKIWGILGAVVAYAIGMQFDYTISTAIFLFVMFLWLGRGEITMARLAKNLFMAIALTGFLYLAFVVWLNVSVPVLL